MNNSPVGLGSTDGFIRQINGTNSSLTGDLDDAAIFDRALSQAEIQNIIDSGVPTTTTTTTSTTTTTTFSNTVPYEEPFEAYADGLSIAGTNGWIGLLNAANVSADAALAGKLSIYTNSGLAFPIASATHDKVLCVNASQVISNRIAAADTTLFTDLLWLPG